MNEQGLAPHFTERLADARAATNYAEAIGELGQAAHALLDYHGRVRHELPERTARALYLLHATADEIVMIRDAALRAEQERVRDALRQALRFAVDHMGRWHVMFAEASGGPDDVVDDLSYCGGGGADLFVSYHAELPVTATGAALCPECAVKAIAHLFTPGALARRPARGERQTVRVPPVSEAELAENESGASTGVRCPGPPHYGHASSDWYCPLDRPGAPS